MLKGVDDIIGWVIALAIVFLAAVFVVRNLKAIVQGVFAMVFLIAFAAGYVWLVQFCFTNGAPVLGGILAGAAVLGMLWSAAADQGNSD